MSDETILRAVQRTSQAVPTMEGAGVRLRRAFGFDDLPQLDPFLLLDCFRSDDPEDWRLGFPWHPHRGIETITYVLDGDIEHADSLGNRGIISSGDVQWMTAGSGIIHQEMPLGDGKGRMAGFQLWSNLPASAKMTEPRYQEVKSAAIPSVTTRDGAVVRVVAGEIDGVLGPVTEIATDPLLVDVTLPPNATFTHAIPRGHRAFAQVFEGEAAFDPALAEQGAAGRSATDTLVVFGDGDAVAVRTGAKPARFLLVAGRPLAEPVAWAGPVVMNTREELRAAFREIDAGTFVKHARR